MKTMLEDFLEKYPNAPINDKGLPAPCPRDLGYEKDAFYDCSLCNACWNRPVPPVCYKNVTVIIDGDETSWVRQDNTERISEDEAMEGVKIRVKANE